MNDVYRLYVHATAKVYDTVMSLVTVLIQTADQEVSATEIDRLRH